MLKVGWATNTGIQGRVALMLSDEVAVTMLGAGESTGMIYQD